MSTGDLFNAEQQAKEAKTKRSRASRKKVKRLPRRPERDSERRGNLKIGDDWNAITIIALSQSNPLKAIAEFVEA